MIPSWQMAAYERLRNEVVRQAVNDYKIALRKSARDGVVCGEQRRLERWFLSKWGQTLCENNGQYIIDRCRQTYKTYNGKMRAAPMTLEKEEKVYRDFKAGMPKKEITRKHNITDYQYYQMLRRRG